MLREGKRMTISINGRDVRPANDDMIEGYYDGRDPDSPEPSANRSASYRHGHAVGRAEIENRRLGSFDAVVAAADRAMTEDERR